MLLSKLYSLGSLAFRPTQDLAPSHRLAPGLLDPRRSPAPALRVPKRHMFGMNVPESLRPTQDLAPSHRLAPGLLDPRRSPAPALRVPKRHMFGMNVPESLRPTQDLAPSHRLAPGLLDPRRSPAPALRVPKRHMFGMNVPESQYDNNALPKRMQLGYALSVHWEVIPLFVCVVVDFIVIFYGGVYTGLTQKIDTQFTRHNCNCIARNMDLRHPTIHKHVVYHQQYEPWPEMQEALDKMKKAEHRLQSRLSSCPAT